MRRVACFAFTCFAFLVGVVASADPPPASLEIKVKAAYLLNFAKYVEWPAEAFSGKDAPIVLVLLGEDPFGEVLDKTLEGRVVQGRRVVVRRIKQLADLKECHLLYLSASEKDRLAEDLKALRGKPVLTVGEDPSMFEHGGTIHFLLDEEAVRFNIDRDAAERAGLRVSSRMLGAAKKVVSSRNEGEK